MSFNNKFSNLWELRVRDDVGHNFTMIELDFKFIQSEYSAPATELVALCDKLSGVNNDDMKLLISHKITLEEYYERHQEDIVVWLDEHFSGSYGIQRVIGLDSRVAHMLRKELIGQYRMKLDFRYCIPVVTKEFLYNYIKFYSIIVAEADNKDPEQFAKQQINSCRFTTACDVIQGNEKMRWFK